jgi:RNA recognition motif-containing protein
VIEFGIGANGDNLTVSCFGGDSPCSSMDLVIAESVPGHLITGGHSVPRFFEREVAMNIFVGNLPFSTSESDLRAMFADYGDIESVAIITDRDTGRSRGFGFVELSDNTRAADALRDLDGTDIDGRSIRVNEAEQRRRS